MKLEINYPILSYPILSQGTPFRSQPLSWSDLQRSKQGHHWYTLPITQLWDQINLLLLLNINIKPHMRFYFRSQPFTFGDLQWSKQCHGLYETYMKTRHDIFISTQPLTLGRHASEPSKPLGFLFICGGGGSWGPLHWIQGYQKLRRGRPHHGADICITRQLGRPRSPANRFRN